MPEANAKPKRRWFQFSLRTLLIAVTLAAGLLVAWRVYVEPYRRQLETTKRIEELGGKYTAEPEAAVDHSAVQFRWRSAYDLALALEYD